MLKIFGDRTVTVNGGMEKNTSVLDASCLLTETERRYVCAMHTRHQQHRPTDRTTETHSREAVECFVYFGLNYNHPQSAHSVGKRRSDGFNNGITITEIATEQHYRNVWKKSEESTLHIANTHAKKSTANNLYESFGLDCFISFNDL